MVSADTVGWTPRIIEHAAATISLSPERPSIEPHSDLQSWYAGQSEVLASVGHDRDVPMYLEDITWPFSLTAGRSDCPVSIDGHRGVISSYFEMTRTPHLGREYVAALSLELVPGSWLNIGTISENGADQARMLSALRTVRFFDAARDGSAVPPSCPASPVDTTGWEPIRIESAPVAFLAPPGSSMRTGYSGEVWDVGSMRVDFVPLGTRAWKFDPARKNVELWCRMERGGREIELQIIRDFPKFSRSAKVRAYIRLSDDRVLHFYGWVLDEVEGTDVLRTVVSTVRP